MSKENKKRESAPLVAKKVTNSVNRKSSNLNRQSGAASYSPFVSSRNSVTRKENG